MAEFKCVQHFTDIFDLPNRFRTNLKHFRTRFLFPFIRFPFALPINGNAVCDIL